MYERIPWQDYPEHGVDENTMIALTESELQLITPKSAEHALKCDSHEHWLAAMNREKDCHVKNGTFGEEWKGAGPCPKPIPAGWVFKIKHRGPPIDEKDLMPKQFKARVVIRGQYMKEGLDFNDTFAPVAKPMTIRAVLAVAAKYGCTLMAGDVETAFLTADIAYFSSPVVLSAQQSSCGWMTSSLCRRLPQHGSAFSHNFARSSQFPLLVL